MDAVFGVQASMAKSVSKRYRYRLPRAGLRTGFSPGVRLSKPIEVRRTPFSLELANKAKIDHLIRR
jgi:hypothetical protein